MVRAPAGGVLSSAACGQDQLAWCVDDILRTAQHGIRSALISDLGVMRQAGSMPADMQAEVSVMLPVANPAAAVVIERLGRELVARSRYAATISEVGAPGLGDTDSVVQQRWWQTVLLGGTRR